MAYELKTERGDLGDGDYAIMYQDMRHGTQKATNLLTRPFLTYPEGESPKVIIEGENAKLEGSKPTGFDWEAVDWGAVYDAMIIGQVKEWSFGPVDQQILNDLHPDKSERLVKELDMLYGKQNPLPGSGGGN